MENVHSAIQIPSRYWRSRPSFVSCRYKDLSQQSQVFTPAKDLSLQSASPPPPHTHTHLQLAANVRFFFFFHGAGLARRQLLFRCCNAEGDKINFAAPKTAFCICSDKYSCICNSPRACVFLKWSTGHFLQL